MTHARIPIARCPACGADQREHVRDVGPFHVERCVACGLQMTNPQPSDAELAEIYDASYFFTENDVPRDHVAELKQRTAGLYLDVIGQHDLPGGKRRLLEVGCGHGDFLVEAARRGFEVSGVEYSSHACDVARAKLAGAGTVVRGEIEQLVEHRHQFDLCVACDVIEHVRRPDDFLRQMHDLLVPGGLCFLATPTLDSWSARMFGTHWMEYKAEHMTYFSRASLQRLLRHSGFEIVAERRGAKILSVDYIAGHFARYPVPVLSPVVACVRRFTPPRWRRRPVRLVASGITMLGRTLPR